MSQEKSSKKHKVFSVICTVLTVIIAALTVAIVVNIIVCRAKHKPVSFFGTSFAIVQTESMKDKINVGDLILFHSCDYSDVKEGDYIVFIADENFPKEIQGQSIVHEAMEITPEGIRTKGINNGGYDGGYRTEDELLGICTFNSTGWGKFFTFLSKFGIIIVIAIIALPFIIKQIIKIVKLSKNGNGDNAEEPQSQVEKADGNKEI